jgi:hypothetical protein
MMLAADGAVWIAANVNGFNLGIARIPQQQASDQRTAKTNEDLQCLRCLHRPDNANQRRKNTHGGAIDFFWCFVG